MNIRKYARTLKSGFLKSVYMHDPLCKGNIGKVMGVLLIFNFILFVILFFTEVIIPYRNGEFPPYRLGP